MNKNQARELLQACRPGGRDENDPEFAAALEQLATKPELARQFARQQNFDAGVSAAVKQIPVPPGLKAALLAARPATPARPWWRRPVPARWAAALLVAGGLAAVWVKPAEPTFADFRHKMLDAAWHSTPHVELESSDFNRIKLWLARNEVHTDFVLPAGLQDLSVRGCRVVEWQGCKAGVICFAKGPRHFHLFVTEGVHFADLPPHGLPDFEKYAGWNTASWRHGDNAYLLTGMNNLTFLKKFRKARQWMTPG